MKNNFVSWSESEVALILENGRRKGNSSCCRDSPPKLIFLSVLCASPMMTKNREGVSATASARWTGIGACALGCNVSLCVKVYGEWSSGLYVGAI